MAHIVLGSLSGKLYKNLTRGENQIVFIEQFVSQLKAYNILVSDLQN